VASEDAVSYDWADEDVAPGTGTPMNLWGHTPPSSSIEPAVVREMEPAVTIDEVHPHARELPNDIDGIDTRRETNPRVR
jgi:hypothetical protein